MNKSQGKHLGMFKKDNQAGRERTTNKKHYKRIWGVGRDIEFNFMELRNPEMTKCFWCLWFTVGTGQASGLKLPPLLFEGAVHYKRTGKWEAKSFPSDSILHYY